MRRSAVLVALVATTLSCSKTVQRRPSSTSAGSGGPAGTATAAGTTTKEGIALPGKVDALLSHTTRSAQASFLFAGGKKVYVDPYQLSAGEPKADLILVTHAHFDHLSSDDIAKIQGPDTVVIAPRDCASKLSGKVETISPGETKTVAGVKVEAVPAYNLHKEFHRKSSGWVGYVFTLDGVRVYHAGDTDFIPEMKSLKDIDIACLPIGGTYTMDWKEAVKAAEAIKAKLTIPMHYGAVVGSDQDAVNFQKAYKGPVKILGAR